MQIKRYVALWHEENDSGVPTHNMGISELFKTELEAWSYVKRCVDEDKERFDEAKADDKEHGIVNDDEFFFGEHSDSDVSVAIGNGQKTFYKVEKVWVDCEDAAKAQMEFENKGRFLWPETI